MNNLHADYREHMLDTAPIAIDLFSGIGGLSLGLEQAGFFSAVHVEKNGIASKYAKYNFPLSYHLGGDHHGDIENTSSDILRDLVGKREIALIAGGPPCQGFSTIGRRRIDDPLNYLVLRLAGLILELEPMAFVIENVPGIKAGQYWQLDQALVQLSSKYYHTDPTELYAPDFGVPQIRKRVFIIGIRRDLGRRPSLPLPTHTLDRTCGGIFSLLQTPTVGEAILDLPDCDQYPELLDGDTVPYDKPPHSEFSRLMRNPSYVDNARNYYTVEWDGISCTNLRRTQHGQDLLERIQAVPPGGIDKRSRIKRLDPDGLALTVRAGTTSERGAWSAPRPCHPIFPRVVTTRESARFQSFPDWFRFHPAKWHGNMQVGNAVPPLLAQAVGRQVLESLKYTLSSKSDITIVNRDDNLIQDDLDAAARAGYATRKTSHKVENTNLQSRRVTMSAPHKG